MKSGVRQKSRKRSARAKRTYDTSLREEQAAMTSERILAVAEELLLDRPPQELSYADVAERAGVSTRTVYRHFPARDELLRAVAKRFVERMQAGVEPITDLASFLRVGRRWVESADEDPRRVDLHFKLPLYSTFGGPPLKRALVEREVPGLSDERLRVVAGFFDLVTSPYALKVLQQHWGLKVGRALPALELFVEAILRAAREHPDRLVDEEAP